MNVGGVRGVQAYRAQSYSSLEKIAATVRTRLLPKSDPESAVPGLKLFEGLDDYHVTVRGTVLRLQYGVEDLAPGLEAEARYSVDEQAILVVLTPSTYRGLVHGTGRSLFTLCHEVGHAVLHPAELVDRALAAINGAALHRTTPSDHKVFRDTEWQADGFAAAMLMPASALSSIERSTGALNVRNIASRFSVSQVAAELRLKVFLARRRELLT